MPKITEHDGPSEDPMDAPNARPSEEAYNDAMSRHGTPDYTGADQRLVERYQEIRTSERREEDAEADRKNIEQRNRTSGEAKSTEVKSSPGTSSSQSDENNKQNTTKRENADQKAAQETGNRSTGVTTVSSVGGNTRATKK